MRTYFANDRLQTEVPESFLTNIREHIADQRYDGFVYYTSITYRANGTIVTTMDNGQVTIWTPVD